MLKLGVFCGKYMTDCRREFPKSWFANAKLARGKRDCALNFFGVDASQPLSEWKRKGWIHRDDPRGWFQWYCRYYMGRRMPDEDARQIKRWKAIRRMSGKCRRIANPAICFAAGASARRSCTGPTTAARFRRNPVSKSASTSGQVMCGLWLEFDFVGAPALAPGPLEKLAEAVVRRMARAIDVMARQCQRTVLQPQLLLESLARLRLPSRLAPGNVLRRCIGRHRPRRNEAVAARPDAARALPAAADRARCRRRSARKHRCR